jgi:UDP-galactopyranose mutase
MVDYIIVGSGLAGIAFAEIALNNKSIVVLTNASKFFQNCWRTYNPKTFSEVWQAQEQLF